MVNTTGLIWYGNMDNQKSRLIVNKTNSKFVECRQTISKLCYHALKICAMTSSLDNAFHVLLWIFPRSQGSFLISQMRNHERLKFFLLQISKAPLMWPELFGILGPQIYVQTEQLILWSWPHFPMSISTQLSSVYWSQPKSSCWINAIPSGITS